MNIWSPLPRSTTFVSPVTSKTPASAAACFHGLNDAPEIVQAQTFFENESHRKIKRFALRTSPGH